ncbi:MAG: glycosyl hydrolase-related protein [Lachnospiraceae bacterium]|jgi:alpha-mannosidase|nr:glycosyl hydrolase-related protein [Lachnospiraceae bacterium]
MRFDMEKIEQTLLALKGCIVEGETPVEGVLFREGAADRFPKEWERPIDRYRPFGREEVWSGRDVYAVFRLAVRVPEVFAGKVTRLLVTTGREDRWEATNPQFIVWDRAGFKQGLDVNHREIYVTPDRGAKSDGSMGVGMVHRVGQTACGIECGETYELLLEGWSGLESASCCFRVDMQAVNPLVEALYYDLSVAKEAVFGPEQAALDKEEMTAALLAAADLLDLRDLVSGGFYDSVARCRKYLETEFFGRFAGNPVTVHCIGHGHIDVAWQWRTAHSRRKAARTFGTAIDFMGRYPGYRFFASQPQLYKYIKEDYPELYAEIKRLTREGRFEQEGAMWLEADCNLIGGESMVRQLIHGKRFMMEEFGADSHILWLPDVFGYSAAMPQILKLAGVDCFVTSKISWNEYNRIPHDVFMWQGIDGSRVLTYFLTTPDKAGMEGGPHYATYSAKIRPEAIVGTWDRFQDKGVGHDVLCAYGYGDGGGGPTKDDMEYAMRLQGGLPGVPQVKQAGLGEFLARLSDNIAEAKAPLAKWQGELYLEFHRGTYTSVARIKRYNRMAENALRTLEFALAARALLSGMPCDRSDEVYGMWEAVLENQFHDILPGSSIREVYEDAFARYEWVLDRAKSMTEEALAKATGMGQGDAGGAVTGGAAPGGTAIATGEIGEPWEVTASGPKAVDVVAVWNFLAFDRDDVVVLDGCQGAGADGVPWAMESTSAADADGGACHTQKTWDGRWIAYAKGIPSMGYRAFYRRQITMKESDAHSVGNVCRSGADVSHGTGVSPMGEHCMQISTSCMENAFFRIEFDANMEISSLWDKREDRQLLLDGARGNALTAYEDRPRAYDAWELTVYYRDKAYPVRDVQEARVIETGPVRGGIQVQRSFMSSTVTQRIFAYSDIQRIDFETEVDWKESHMVLKANFPVDVLADEATFDIQMGNLKRPTHSNTSWDFAKFEVCGHKWADVSEGGYGVALLNDCKYGYRAKDGSLELTLLKSATFPFAGADKELHRFTYALYPHVGDFAAGGVHGQAARLNCPLYVAGEGGSASMSFVRISAGNIYLEAVKPAYDGDGVVLRLYEFENRRTRGTLSVIRDVVGAWECDLLENNLRELPWDGKDIRVEFRPYEVKTVRVQV